MDDRYAASLDVIGHELTHGVANSVGTKGVLEYTGQSGALNESFADIFGEMIESRSNGGSPDWLLGTVLNRIVRNLSNPPAILRVDRITYPKKMSEFVPLPLTEAGDGGGVHINSSIINRAYYLIAAGLGGGIGISDSEQIFYRTLTTKCLPQSQFIDARVGAIASAEDLFGVGSRQAVKVAEGFDAIELYAAPVSVPHSPTNLPAVFAPESTLWLYYDSSTFDYSLGRYEAALGDTASGARLATLAK